MKQAILAVGSNREFGKDLGLPWPKIADDLPTFKKLTERTTLVMGSKTYESLPFLPSDLRQFIVVTRDKVTSNSPNLMFIHPDNLSTFLNGTGRKVSLIGGISLFTLENLKLMDKVYLAEVVGSFAADTFLPQDVLAYIKSLPSDLVFSNDQAEMRVYYA